MTLMLPDAKLTVRQNNVYTPQRTNAVSESVDKVLELLIRRRSQQVRLYPSII